MKCFPRILVVGGGAVGSAVAVALTSLSEPMKVRFATRRPVSHLSARVDQILVDVRHEHALRSALEGIDIAVIALGPFSNFGASIHRQCLAAGVDVVDINDSDLVVDELLELDKFACENDRRILTGLGFMPGLSTLLLYKTARDRQWVNGDYQISTYMGALNAGGASNSTVLIESFRSSMPCLDAGSLSTEGYSFREIEVDQPGSEEAMRKLAIPFASPEYRTLCWHGSASRLGVDSLRCHYHVQYLAPWTARLFAQLGLYRHERLKSWISNLFYKLGRRLSARPDAEDTTSIKVSSTPGDENGYRVHGLLRTSHITGCVAIAGVLLLTRQRTAVPVGVLPMERLLLESPTASDHFENYLKCRGIIISNGKPLEHAAERLHSFGQSATFDGSVSSLRHFGQCWYSLDKVPMKIIRLQLQCLKQSRLWREILDNTSMLARAVELARMKLRHRQLQRAAMSRRFGLHVSDEVNRRIIRDFSLFAAGYQQTKKILGPQRAWALYSEMFLTSSQMEMNWFWPPKTVFAHADRPIETLSLYLEAYFLACQRLGVSELTVWRLPEGLEVNFDQCRYGDILRYLGSPDLSHLVRQMEIKAISVLAEACGLEVHWSPGGEPGQGRLKLKRTAESGVFNEIA